MQLSEDILNIIDEIILANPYNREYISDKLINLKSEIGIARTLDVLFRQQLHAGFILINPDDISDNDSRLFEDEKTGIQFKVEWNPARELRKQHNLLIDRDIIDGEVDQSRLINKDVDNKPCYLCRSNINLQNPLEILFPIKLFGNDYYCGANFAPITRNHFTIMSSEHIEQRYRNSIMSSMIDFVLQTDGEYRAIFNGRAGASILSHLHLQATTEKLPVEDIRINDGDYIISEANFSISKPNYYLPLYIVEGNNFTKVEKNADNIINRWLNIDQDFNTQNILVRKVNESIRVFIFLRDRRRLIGDGKEGDMGTFECSGELVLSSDIKVKGESGIERVLYDNITLEKITALLSQISPDDSNFNIDFLDNQRN